MSELPPESLNRPGDPTAFPSDGMNGQIQPTVIIGQPRATAALRFGLNMRDRGYHVFVAGPSGTGKMTAVNTFLGESARARPTPDDWCYVYNFADPEHPRALRLPAGRVRELARDLDRLQDAAIRQIPLAFESDQYTNQRDAMLKELDEERETRLGQLNEYALKQGFTLQAAPMGLMIVPLRKGKPMSEDDFNALTPEQREELQRRRADLDERIEGVMKALRGRERTVREALEHLDHDVALYAVGGLLEDVSEHYRDVPSVIEYLTALREDLAAHVSLFRPAPETSPTLESPIQRQQALRRYRVNVVVEHGASDGAPVVVETNPTYQNLIGRIEKESQFGVLTTDFTLIRGGALHRANGGYLIVEAMDLLRQPLVWDGLKRSLRDGRTTIEDPVDLLGLSTVRGLRPEPIPLDVKVVLVGEASTFYLLYSLDPDFRELFRVRADFDLTMPRTTENELAFASFVGRVSHDEQLRPFDQSALATLVGFSSRLAEDQEKLSLQFGELTNLVRVASYWAGQAGASTVSAEHVRSALDQQIYRSNLYEERIQELISRDILLVDVAGEAVGQVNGLAVQAFADYQFGRPSRITASVGVGREGVVDVEREAQLGGHLHSKGVLILSGFLVDRFAREQPLALSARLVFEQSYEEVDGDSASSTELYALLSGLSDLPIRQELAVTGSVNQRGQIQAIGGVNEKIEGFFAVCRAKGLSGRQGVLIPAANAKNLMLKDDVVDAVRAGKFHIHAVSTVDEGIALLTGRAAGERGPDGHFPSETVNGRIEARLAAMMKTWRASVGGTANGMERRVVG